MEYKEACHLNSIDTNTFCLDKFHCGFFPQTTKRLKCQCCVRTNINNSLALVSTIHHGTGVDDFLSWILMIDRLGNERFVSSEIDESSVRLSAFPRCGCRWFVSSGVVNSSVWLWTIHRGSGGDESSVWGSLIYRSGYQLFIGTRVLMISQLRCWEFLVAVMRLSTTVINDSSVPFTSKIHSSHCRSSICGHIWFSSVNVPAYGQLDYLILKKFYSSKTCAFDYMGQCTQIFFNKNVSLFHQNEFASYFSLVN